MSINLETLLHLKYCQIDQLCSLRVIHYNEQKYVIFHCCCWSLISNDILYCKNPTKRVGLLQSGKHRHLTEIYLAIVVK